MREPKLHSEYFVRPRRHLDKNASKIDIQFAVWFAFDTPPDLTGKFLRDRKVIAW
jgi:hypothetical protein